MFQQNTSFLFFNKNRDTSHSTNNLSSLRHTSFIQSISKQQCLNNTSDCFSFFISISLSTLIFSNNSFSPPSTFNEKQSGKSRESFIHIMVMNRKTFHHSFHFMIVCVFEWMECDLWWMNKKEKGQKDQFPHQLEETLSWMNDRVVFLREEENHHKTERLLELDGSDCDIWFKCINQCLSSWFTKPGPQGMNEKW